MEMNTIKKFVFYFLLIESVTAFAQTLGLDCKDEKYGIEKFSIIDLTNKTIKYHDYSKVFTVEITDSEVRWKIQSDKRVSASSYEGYTYFRLNRFSLTMDELVVFVGGTTLRSTYSCKSYQKKF